MGILKAIIIALEAVWVINNNYLQIIIIYDPNFLRSFRKRSFRQNKNLGCFVLMSGSLATKTETTKIYKSKLSIAMEVLNKVSVKSPETEEFIAEAL